MFEKKHTRTLFADIFYLSSVSLSEREREIRTNFFMITIRPSEQCFICVSSHLAQVLIKPQVSRQTAPLFTTGFINPWSDV